MNGRLVVLNGASSAGKTLTAQALAPRLGAGCIVTGLDDLLARAQPFGPEGDPALWRSLRVIAFQATDGRFKLFQRLHREVVAHVRAGKDVIVETALMDDRARQDAAACFAPIGGFFIGLQPPLEVSERWEAARGDRPPGQARRHYDLVHAHGVYDLLLDPSHLTPADCAGLILDRLGGEPSGAFRRLAGQAQLRA